MTAAETLALTEALSLLLETLLLLSVLCGVLGAWLYCVGGDLCDWLGDRLRWGRRL